jgi:hypothetical protein
MIERSKRWVAVLRTLHQSDKINAVSEGAELLYRRLLEVVDDNGNYYAEPGLILGYIFAHRMANNQLTTNEMAARVQELATAELVQFYADGRLLHVVDHFTKLRSDVTPDIRFDPCPARMRNGRGPGPARMRPARLDQTRLDQTEPDETEPKEPPAPSADALGLARLLTDSLRTTFPNLATSKLAGGELDRHLTRWALEFDRFGRLDGKTPAEYRAIIEWAMADDFWQKNIQSPGALRTQRKGGNAKVWADFEKAQNPRRGFGVRSKYDLD